MKVDLDSLNSNQLQAVNWQNGPLLVRAGPGAGKTHVLTTRIARIISDSPDARFRILGLTFTTKAADEMRNRVVDMLGGPTPRVRLATFHSFAADVLRLHGSHFGLRPDFRIIARDEERHELLSDAIENSAAKEHLPARANGKSIVLAVDLLFREGYDGCEMPARLGTPKPWVEPVFKAYLELLVKNNYLDFGALLVYCLRLFRERPAVTRHYRTVYPFVCVDEYQDTNNVQDLLLRAIHPANGDADLFVVADEDQTIYQWNGASPRRLADLCSHYGMDTVQLPQSYRCPAPVVALANRLISRNQSRLAGKAPLVAVGDGTAPQSGVSVQSFANDEAEANWIAQNIRERRLPPGDCLVLARSAKLLQAVAAALRRIGLCPYVPQRKQEFETPLLVFVHSTLRLYNKPADFAHLLSLCDAYGALTGEATSPDKITADATLNGGESLLRRFAAVVRPSEFREAVANLLEKEHHRDFVATMLNTSRDASGPEREEIGVWQELDWNIQRSLGANPTLSQFLQELDLRQKTSPAGANDVQCLTIHLAKGKERRHVYLMGLAEEQLPSYYAVRDGTVEEERRSCFVAITRAQETLTLTYAHQYSGYAKQPSRFLAEMGYVP